MKMKKEQPKIISVVDLSHLPQGKSLKYDQLSRRRNFLIQMGKMGILIGVPSLGVMSCITSDKDSDKSCECDADTSCSCQSEESCVCEADSGCSCDSEESCACETDQAVESNNPRIKSTYPEDGDEIDSDSTNLAISVSFTKQMNRNSVEEAFSISPEIGGIINWTLSSDSFRIAKKMFIGSTMTYYEPKTKYTIVIKGTAKDVDGYFLDGNGDGVGGDNFTLTFTTKGYTESCSCDSYSSGCTSYTCSCVSFTCSCQFAGCPTYRI